MKNKWLITVFQNFLIKNIVCTGEQAKQAYLYNFVVFVSVSKLGLL